MHDMCDHSSRVIQASESSDVMWSSSWEDFLGVRLVGLGLAEARLESGPESRLESGPESRLDSRPESRLELRLEARLEPRLEPRLSEGANWLSATIDFLSAV